MLSTQEAGGAAGAVGSCGNAPARRPSAGRAAQPHNGSAAVHIASCGARPAAELRVSVDGHAQPIVAVRRPAAAIRVGRVHGTASRELAMLLAAQSDTALTASLGTRVATRRKHNPAGVTAAPGDSGVCVSAARTAAILAAPRLASTPHRRSKRSRVTNAALDCAAHQSARPDKRQRLQPSSAVDARSMKAGMLAHASACAREADALNNIGGNALDAGTRQRSRGQQFGQQKAPVGGGSMVSTRSSVTAASRTAMAHSTSASVDAAGVLRRRTRSQPECCEEDACTVGPSAVRETAVPQSQHKLRTSCGSNTASGTASRQEAICASTATVPPALYTHRPQLQPAASVAAGAAAEKPQAPLAAAAAMPKRVAVKRELAALLVGTNSVPMLSDGGSSAGLRLRGRCIQERSAMVGKSSIQADSAPAQSPVPTVLIPVAEQIAKAPLCRTACADCAAKEIAAAAVHRNAAGAVIATLPAPNGSPTSDRLSAIAEHRDAGVLSEPAESAAAEVSGSAFVSGPPAADKQSADAARLASAEPSGMLPPLPPRPPAPLLPPPPRWGCNGLRSMDVAAAAATARGRALRAVRPDYARLAATEVATARLPVWPASMQVPAERLSLKKLLSEGTCHTCKCPHHLDAV